MKWNEKHLLLVCPDDVNLIYNLDTMKIKNRNLNLR
jgi:hypothetical protein